MKSNCLKCRHYFITHDVNAPKGCKAYGIKSAQFPNMVVRSANKGQDCIGFEPKEAKKGLLDDLNDQRLWDK